MHSTLQNKISRFYGNEDCSAATKAQEVTKMPLCSCKCLAPPHLLPHPFPCFFPHAMVPSYLVYALDVFLRYKK